MLKKIKKPILYSCLIILAFLLVVINFSFPEFTSDEARIAYRGSVLAQQGKDELGRSFPLLFNSSTDYQLPVVSYIAALGEKIFGKTDLGARIPFFLLGLATVAITYKIAKLFSQNEKFRIVASLVLIFSPALNFLSKAPNDSIVLTFFMTLLVYLLIKDKPNIILIFAVAVLTLMVSKFAWFIIPPTVIFILFFFRFNLPEKMKVKLTILSLILVAITAGLYLQVPQSKRSLSENNFSIFTNSTIKNGINKSRGEGIKSGWPNYLEPVLFNKTFFPVIGFMHWMSNLGPGVYFGQFDERGKLNFSQAGAFSKILVIPFIGGLIYLVQRGSKKERLTLGFFIILTFPAIFIYPDFSRSLIVLTLPFTALIIAFGLMQFNRIFSLLVILLMVLELGLNLFFFTSEKKETNLLRPGWIKIITRDVYNQSLKFRTAISDDIVSDVVNFIEWYNPVDARAAFLDVPYPYKFRQTNINNIKIIGSDNELHSCNVEDYEKVFVSRRDMEKIKDPGIKIIKTYRDSLNHEMAYLLQRGLCIK